jgi:hypothetical protein
LFCCEGGVCVPFSFAGYKIARGVIVLLRGRVFMFRFLFARYKIARGCHFVESLLWGSREGPFGGGLNLWGGAK